MRTRGNAYRPRRAIWTNVRDNAVPAGTRGCVYRDDAYAQERDENRFCWVFWPDGDGPGYYCAEADFVYEAQARPEGRGEVRE